MRMTVLARPPRLFDRSVAPFGLPVLIASLLLLATGLSRGAQEPPVGVESIRFEGVEALSRDELLQALDRFGARNECSADRLEQALQNALLSRYRQRGYLAARGDPPRVESVEVVENDDRVRRCRITFSITEGERFRYGNAEFAGSEEVEWRSVLEAAGVRPGAPVDQGQLTTFRQELRRKFSRLGYFDAGIEAELRPEPATATAPIRVSVEEGPQYIVRLIQFSGLSAALDQSADRSLRDALLLTEESPFNRDLLERSISQLDRLGLFEPIEDPDVTLVLDADRSEVDILISLREKKP